MPADLTAAEIIALLREHPVCCGRLGLELYHNGVSAYQYQLVAFDHDESPHGDIWSKWLTGACVEWCIANGVELPVQWRDGWATYEVLAKDPEFPAYSTFLHAMLAAIERHPD